MPNRKLSPNELSQVNVLIEYVRTRLCELSDNDHDLLFAYRRKLTKELIYDERGKPIMRRKLKAQKLKEQGGLCPICSKPLPERYAVLDRLMATAGYTPENTRLIHDECDKRIQNERRYT